MRLAEESKRLYVEFFEELGVCTRSDFPEVLVFSGLGARVVTGVLLVDGITIGRAVYVSPNFVWRGKSGNLLISKQLLAHEIVHVLQYSREGIPGFLKTYIRHFWRLFRGRKRWTAKAWFEAYLSIPHEIEARELAARFKPWLTSRKTNY